MVSSTPCCGGMTPEDDTMSCGAITYVTANNGGGEQFGGGEIARRQRIEASVSSGRSFWKKLQSIEDRLLVQCIREDTWPRGGCELKRWIRARACQIKWRRWAVLCSVEYIYIYIYTHVIHHLGLYI
jgi:hypothetical protein